MTQPNSYPSPHAAHEDIHPFYNANQHHMPPAEHSHIPPAMAAPMQGGARDTRDFAQGNDNGQNIRQPQPSTPQQLAQRGLEADQSQDPNNPESSSRKRSKVSRACDECRRKKVCRSPCNAEIGAQPLRSANTDLGRYGVMQNQRHPVLNAPLVAARVKSVTLVEHRKREVQAKGRRIEPWCKKPMN